MFFKRRRDKNAAKCSAELLKCRRLGHAYHVLCVRKAFGLMMCVIFMLQYNSVCPAMAVSWLCKPAKHYVDFLYMFKIYNIYIRYREIYVINIKNIYSYIYIVISIYLYI